MRLPAIGTPAPSFRLPSAQGADVALEDYRGRSVVLWFSKGLF
ncbi:MAG: redoxin domain-containing protein [Candidatus Rokubacteria bacterium]|nr:redoxin domain-containing protein [Candidatus Rokubacteria bacterium]